MRTPANPFRTGLVLSVCTAILAVAGPAPAWAHNKVVVIPMAGDDITPDPFRPVAPHSPQESNYTITFGSLFTAVDETTGLEWQRFDDNTTRTWNAAWSYCVGLTLNGKSDWRLPGVLELQSIVDYGGANPSINSTAFPGTNASSYWSASSDASDSTLAWRVIFNNGFVVAVSKTGSYFVRCVR